MKLRLGFAQAKSGKYCTYSCWSLLALALLLAVPCRGQIGQSGQNQGGSGGLGQGHLGNIPQPQSPLDPLEDVDPVIAQRRLRMLNTERQKSMVSDTNKLLKLAAELNDEVSSAKPDALTPAQLRKVAEIEKLAHNIKQKMSYAGMPGPVFEQRTLPNFQDPHL
jgi:hypothetical protein